MDDAMPDKTDENKSLQTQGIIENDPRGQVENLGVLLGAFLLDRRAQNLTAETVAFYADKLRRFLTWCDTQAVKNIEHLTPDVLRSFLLRLQDTGHNEGGRHAYYRCIRVFLNWYANEFDPPNWKNPIRKVKAPKVSIEPLEPADLDGVRAMLATCKGAEKTSIRDKLILLTLLDTGMRAGEMLRLDRADVDPIAGDILIRKSKSRRPRTVFLGRDSRRALRAYLKTRPDKIAALFVTDDFDGRLTYDGLRAIVTRRAILAGVNKPPSLHSFRRLFALNMLRAGVDIFSLQKLMGHASLDVLRRYLAQTTEDTKAAHDKGSPVDRLL